MTAKVRRYASELGWPIGISLAMLALWEFAVRELGIRSIILPPPSEIAQAIIARHDLLLTHLWPSLYLTVLGFALSVVGGVLVGSGRDACFMTRPPHRTVRAACPHTAPTSGV
jgi:NitT/TauT family transport system permease protein